MPAADAQLISAQDLACQLGLPAPTPEQRDVIEAPLSSMLVVAGAGSGKTETMAARVVWLVANGLVEPATVLGLTFTRKAARELRGRITRRLAALGMAGRAGDFQPEPASGSADHGDLSADSPDVQTYHGYAGGVLAEFGMLIGLEPDARLLTPASAWQLAHDVVGTYQGPMDAVDLAPSTVTRAVLALGDELSEHLCPVGVAQQWSADLESAVTALPAGGAGRIPAPVRQLLQRTAARRQLLDLLEHYRNAKRERGCLDFADQVALTARLVEQHPWVAHRERARRRLVLLDEFQDTSPAQLAVLHGLFAAETRPITQTHQTSETRQTAQPRQTRETSQMSDSGRSSPGAVDGFSGGEHPPVPVIAVGDPHQSIYGWRGAGADTLGRFARVFARSQQPVTTRWLSTSWRNAERILAVANQVVAPLAGGGEAPVRRLVPAPSAAIGQVDLARCPDEAAEAALVADWIAERCRGLPAATDDVCTTPSAAVLCRRREQIPVMARALRAAGLTVQEVGVGGLLTTMEVAHVINALTVAHDPARNDAMTHLLLSPPVLLGPADLDALGAWAAQPGSRPPSGHPHTLAEAITALPPPGWRGPEGQHLGETARHRLTWLAAVIADISQNLMLPLPDLVHATVQILGLDVEIASRPPAQAQAGARQVQRFLEVVADLSAVAPQTTVGGLLAWLEVAADEERGLDLAPVPAEPGSVQVLTVHAAKGLEWDLVAVPGLVEGTFPAVRVGGSRVRNGQWAVTVPRDPGWTHDVGAMPYDLRADRDALPRLGWQHATDLTELHCSLTDFGEQNAERVLAEERRLMYVATTRARQQLLLTAPVWGNGVTPKVTSRFLHEVRELDRSVVPKAGAGMVRTLQWADMPNPVDRDPSGLSDSRGEPGGRPDPESGGRPEPLVPSWPPPPASCPDLERAAHLVAEWMQGRSLSDHAMTPQESEEFAALDRQIAVLLAERDERESPRLSPPSSTVEALSASMLVARHRDPDSHAVDLQRPVPRRPRPMSRVGTAWHRWIERYYRSGGLFDDDTSQPGIDQIDAGEREAFLDGPWSRRVPVALELPVDTVVGGVPVRGRIDAVFPERDGRFVIVDWKTGVPPTGEQAAAQALQLAVYRTAFARLAGVPIEHVRACFNYARDGSTVYPPMPDEDDLTLFVRKAAQL